MSTCTRKASGLHATCHVDVTPAARCLSLRRCSMGAASRASIVLCPTAVPCLHLGMYGACARYVCMSALCTCNTTRVSSLSTELLASLGSKSSSTDLAGARDDSSLYLSRNSGTHLARRSLAARAPRGSRDPRIPWCPATQRQIRHRRSKN